VPLPSKDTVTVAKALVSRIFTQVGCVFHLLSDQGKEFDNLLLKSLCSLLGTDKIHTTAYKPSTKTCVERLHRSMNLLIAKTIDDNHHNWTKVLPHVMLAYQCAVHESTGYSPNYLLYGRELYAPIDLVTQPLPAEFKVEDYVDEVEKNIRYSHQLARKCLRKATNRRKKYYDLKLSSATYQKMIGYGTIIQEDTVANRPNGKNTTQAHSW
jgi:hypothetical protein